MLRAPASPRAEEKLERAGLRPSVEAALRGEYLVDMGLRPQTQRIHGVGEHEAKVGDAVLGRHRYGGDGMAMD